MRAIVTLGYDALEARLHALDAADEIATVVAGGDLMVDETTILRKGDFHFDPALLSSNVPTRVLRDRVTEVQSLIQLADEK